MRLKKLNKRLTVHERRKRNIKIARKLTQPKKVYPVVIPMKELELAIYGTSTSDKIGKSNKNTEVARQDD